MTYPKDWDACIARTERKLEELKLRRELAAVEVKLARLERQRGMYPPQNTDDALSSEVHIAPLP